MPKKMKVAFATDDGRTINQHFGRLRGLLVIDIAGGAEASRTELGRPEQADRSDGRGHNHVALLDPIGDCDVLVAGGMGLPMAEHVASRGVELVLTAEPTIDTALAAFVAGTLQHEANPAHQPRH